MKSIKIKTTDLKNADGLLDFYRSMGWDGECSLNPTKIKVSESDWLKMSQSIIDKKHRLGFMNYGPSVSKKIPKGYARVYARAFKK
jgi:hypothetical protein